MWFLDHSINLKGSVRFLVIWMPNNLKLSTIWTTAPLMRTGYCTPLTSLVYQSNSFILLALRARLCSDTMTQSSWSLSCTQSHHCCGPCQPQKYDWRTQRLSCCCTWPQSHGCTESRAGEANTQPWGALVSRARVEEMLWPTLTNWVLPLKKSRS